MAISTVTAGTKITASPLSSVITTADSYRTAHCSSYYGGQYATNNTPTCSSNCSSYCGTNMTTQRNIFRAGVSCSGISGTKYSGNNASYYGTVT